MKLIEIKKAYLSSENTEDETVSLDIEAILSITKNPSMKSIESGKFIFNGCLIETFGQTSLVKESYESLLYRISMIGN